MYKHENAHNLPRWRAPPLYPVIKRGHREGARQRGKLCALRACTQLKRNRKARASVVEYVGVIKKDRGGARQRGKLCAFHTCTQCIQGKEDGARQRGRVCETYTSTHTHTHTHTRRAPAWELFAFRACTRCIPGEAARRCPR